MINCCLQPLAKGKADLYTVHCMIYLSFVKQEGQSHYVGPNNKTQMHDHTSMHSLQTRNLHFH